MNPFLTVRLVSVYRDAEIQKQIRNSERLARFAPNNTITSNLLSGKSKCESLEIVENTWVPLPKYIILKFTARKFMFSNNVWV